ncbi:retrovirus-related pol polyprotein from transposon TNT 1-94 [Tanacetum coccineum]
MKNDDGVFLFKFSSKSGMEQVLERGPWMICMSPIILNKWSPSLSSKKALQTKVPIGFARALIEVSSDSNLKKEVIMAIPNKKGNGYIKEMTRVEYEWKSFRHGPITCPKHVKEDVPKALSMVANKPSPMEDQEEGFVEGLVLLAVQVQAEDWGDDGIMDWLRDEINSYPAIVSSFLELLRVLPEMEKLAEDNHGAIFSIESLLSLNTYMKYSSLALEDLSLDHLETKLYGLNDQGLSGGSGRLDLVAPMRVRVEFEHEAH